LKKVSSAQYTKNLYDKGLSADEQIIYNNLKDTLGPNLTVNHRTPQFVASKYPKASSQLLDKMGLDGINNGKVLNVMDRSTNIKHRWFIVNKLKELPGPKDGKGLPLDITEEQLRAILKAADNSPDLKPLIKPASNIDF
jgi:hypothetical protein